MIKVVFCLPGKTFSNYFMEAWSNLLSQCGNFNVEPVLRWAYTSNVYQVRNLCLMGRPELGKKQKVFQGQIKYDYIMWIDSDSVFAPNQFKSILGQMEKNKNLHILSGLYLKEGGKEYTTVLKWNSKFFEKHGRPKSLTPKDIVGKNGLIKVDYTGLGFMLVRQGVFESLDYPWFQPMGLQGDTGLVGFTGEDASFCIRAKEKGFDTYVDPKTIIGHEKSIILK